MSTVAWDGKTLAADRQGTNQGNARPCSKIKKLANGEVAAFTGGIAEGLLMVQWYEHGADPSRFPESQRDKDLWSRLVVAKPDGTVIEYEMQPIGMVFHDEKKAWGSGMDFAIGALAMGATAEQAVRIASRFDTSSGLGVESASPFEDSPVKSEVASQ